MSKSLAKCESMQNYYKERKKSSRHYFEMNFPKLLYKQLLNFRSNVLIVLWNFLYQRWNHEVKDFIDKESLEVKVKKLKLGKQKL